MIEKHQCKRMKEHEIFISAYTKKWVLVNDYVAFTEDITYCPWCGTHLQRELNSRIKQDTNTSWNRQQELSEQIKRWNRQQELNAQIKRWNRQQELNAQITQAKIEHQGKTKPTANQQLSNSKTTVYQLVN